MDESAKPAAPAPAEPLRTERRHFDHEGERSWAWWVIGAAVLVAVALAAYLWLTRQPSAPPPPPVVQAPAPAPVSPLDAPAVIEHPLPTDGAPLPALADSDALLVTSLIDIAGNPRLRDLLQLPELVKRFVATVDNLPREKAPAANWPVKPVGGALRVTGSGESLALAPANAARYAAYVKLFESLDPARLVALYVRTYPLFQQAYADLGYPRGYFNDRLLQVIDHLLAAPEARGPLKLAQPKLVYQYADPELEALSPGQKTLLRMGNDNAARVKAQLARLRDEILRNTQKR